MNWLLGLAAAGGLFTTIYYANLSETEGAKLAQLTKQLASTNAALTDANNRADVFKRADEVAMAQWNDCEAGAQQRMADAAERSAAAQEDTALWTMLNSPD